MRAGSTFSPKTSLVTSLSMPNGVSWWVAEAVQRRPLVRFDSFRPRYRARWWDKGFQSLGRVRPLPRSSCPHRGLFLPTGPVGSEISIRVLVVFLGYRPTGRTPDSDSVYLGSNPSIPTGSQDPRSLTVHPLLGAGDKVGHDPVRSKSWYVGVSSNGKTWVFGTYYGGSIPSAPANAHREGPPYR